MIKPLIVATALVASSGAMAAEFGIGLCQYTVSPHNGEVMWGIKGASVMDDNTYEQMQKYCSSTENMEHARMELSKQPVADPAPLPAEGVNMDEANDTYRACVLGAAGDNVAWLRMLSGYANDTRMKGILHKAHSYGYNVARTYRDCNNYVMGY